MGYMGYFPILDARGTCWRVRIVRLMKANPLLDILQFLFVLYTS